ncbi:male-specific lethal 1 homolog [Tenebrio molitor]|uniref:male-specific lethal 1 homolog n=1 Tax=Tenebrio molitor TaxID=7067 RepID=UPI0036246F43
MMPISSDNAQNIKRFRAKMSDHFPDESNTKLSNLDAVNHLEKKNDRSDNKNELNLPYDHMYASNTENGEIDTTDTNCQSAESEVKFWKEWLILHLDLIQQQSDEIVNKERTILILQQENEMLKERISCMERGAPYQPSKFFNNHPTSFLDESLDMTQDSGPCDEDNKNCIELLDLNCENGDACSPLKLGKFQQNYRLSDGESQAENQTINNKYDSQVTFHNISDNLKTESDLTNCNTSAGFNFTVDNPTDFDPMRNLRMNIRRKRLSNSSAVSNNDSVVEEKRSYRKFKKRRKRVIKDSQILTTTDQYITEATKTNLRLSNITDVPVEIPNNTNLEVPRWRIKVYASCYAMEGTENLDDEVYNKRHSRLENDERRRKRWDVQRIREQRLIEKLKQRQERLGSASRTDEQNDLVQSLCPNVEDVKYLEISEQLPVSAFGSPVPKISPSEFSLPWLNNPSLIVTKKVPVRRSTGRRKNSKR